MNKKLSCLIADWCLKGKALETGEYAAVAFGLEVLLGQLGKTLGILFAGILAGRFFEFLIIIIWLKNQVAVISI